MPSKRHTGPSPRKQPTPTPAPEPSAAEPVTEPATNEASDGDTPEEEVVEPQADPVQPDEQATKDPSEEAEQPGEQSADPDEVRLGAAKGRLRQLPLAEVLAAAKPFAEKIEAMTNTVAVKDLQARMRASEGRCAPVYFTDRGDLIAGDDALSAAKAIGLEQIFVVFVRAEDVGVLQGYLAGQAGSLNPHSDDDELVWRAHNGD